MSDQIEHILQDVLPAGASEPPPVLGMSPPPADGAPDPNGPRMPFRTAYQLERDQEERLVAHCFERIGQLVIDLGRNTTANASWVVPGQDRTTQTTFAKGAETFLGKRELMELCFRNRYGWRKYGLGGVFAHSNLTVPISRRITRQMSARASNFFFGTDPWFGAYPEGDADEMLAAKIGKHAKWKVKRSKLKRKLSHAMRLAFIRGECVLKTTRRVKRSMYRTVARVLVDAVTAEPVLAQDGDYIVEGEAMVEAADPTTGQPVQVLARDQVTQIPADAVYADKLITKIIPIYDGPETGIVFYKDFLCPLNAESIQDADIVVHLYDMPVMELAALCSQPAASPLTSADSTVTATRAAIDLIRQLAGGSGALAGGSQAQRNLPQPESGEPLNMGQGRENPLRTVAEAWVTYDADGDGIAEDVMILLDVESKAPIFYDFVGNVTPDGRRPFTCLRINEVDGRWHGEGAMEMFWPSQEYIDLQVNRLNFSQSGSGRVTFWRPKKTLEGQANPHLALNHGGTYTPADDVADPLKEILTYVALPETKGDDLFKMMEFFLQLMNTEGGVLNANDGQTAGLDSSKLATGIRNIEKSGQEMFSTFLENLEDGVQEALQREIAFIYAWPNESEEFQYLEGDVRELGSLTRDDVRNLSINVELVLTRNQGEESLVANTQAAETVERFYSLPFVVQVRAAALYIQILKSLQVKNAEAIIVPTDIPVPVPVGREGAQSARAAAPRPRELMAPPAV